MLPGPLKSSDLAIEHGTTCLGNDATHSGLGSPASVNNQASLHRCILRQSDLNNPSVFPALHSVLYTPAYLPKPSSPQWCCLKMRPLPFPIKSNLGRKSSPERPGTILTCRVHIVITHSLSSFLFQAGN